jgi:uncharacterized protein YciI
MVRFAALLALFASPSFSAEYSLCLLTAGTESGKIPLAQATELQKQHMAYINHMWESGVLESAGPVAKLPGVRGIFVFNLPVAEAQRWTAKDPKVVAGDLALECHLWQAPAEVGKDYRARYGKPGFKEEMKQYQAAFSIEPASASIVSGAIQHPKWKHFQVLAPNAVLAGEHQIFTWFHDAQVWPNATSK